MSTPTLIKDDIDKFYEYGIYPSSRTIYIGSNDGEGNDEVDAQLAERAIKGLHILDLKANTANTYINAIIKKYIALMSCRFFTLLIFVYFLIQKHYTKLYYQR